MLCRKNTELWEKLYGRNNFGMVKHMLQVRNQGKGTGGRERGSAAATTLAWSAHAVLQVKGCGLHVVRGARGTDPLLPW